MSNAWCVCVRLGRGGGVHVFVCEFTHIDSTKLFFGYTTQERCTSFILHNYIFTVPVVHNSWHYGKAQNVYHVHVRTIKNANRKFWVYLQYVLPPSPTTPPKHMQPFFPLMPPPPISPPPPPPHPHTHKLHSLSLTLFYVSESFSSHVGIKNVLKNNVSPSSPLQFLTTHTSRGEYNV